MALTPRQRRFYSDRFVAYEPVLTMDPSTGRMTKRVYHRRYSGYPCYFQISAHSTEVPTFLGAIEADNLFSRDSIHTDGACLADSGWVLKNVTRERSGAPSQNFGLFWVVSGHPKQVSMRGIRRAYKIQIEAIQFLHPPEGVDPNGLDE